MKTTRRTLFLGGAALGLTACVGTGGTVSRGDTRRLPEGTRLLIVRHFDRDGEDLSREGHARAALLPAVIADIPLDAIYTRQIGRNVDSTRPLARARGMEMQMLSGLGPDGTLPDQVIDAASGRSVIWVGNRDNLREIWEVLALPGEPPLTYGEVFVVEPGRNGRARVTERRMVPVSA
jgi:hypothetical protein